jgi:hypothetical protein
LVLKAYLMKILGTFNTTMAALLMLGVSTMANTTENPKYKVLAEYGELEIRSYQPMIQAVVHTSNGSGFRPLAAYIFGGNESGESISMTAPVATQKSPRGYTTAFMMPGQYTMDLLPDPNNKRVELIEVPARVMAVIRFSGWANQKAVDQHNRELLVFVEERGWSVTGEPIINQYNDPWTAAGDRTNEVQYQLRDYASVPQPQGFDETPEVTLH